MLCHCPEGKVRYRIYLKDENINVDDKKQIKCYSEFDSKPDNAFWKPVEVPRYPEPTYKPDFIPVKDSMCAAINAMKEVRALWKYTIDTARVTYSRLYSKISIPLTIDFLRECKSQKEDFSLYDCYTGKWLVRSKDAENYAYAYDGTNFVETKDLITGKESDARRLLLCGKFTKLMQEPNLLRCSGDVKNDGFVIPELNVVVGVPGCGKTTFILKNHEVGNLVLTSSAEGAADIRERIAREKGGEPSDYRQSYRTVDSYLINSREKYDVVWIDEALMKHPGELFLVCLYTRARVVHLLGDPNQIGYINRVGSISLLYADFRKFFASSRTLKVSYRCPVDVMAHISHKYEGGAVSASKVERSMKWFAYTALANVPNHDDRNHKYLVFKQAEKELLKKAGYDVSTIHEFQGKQAKHIIIVRTSTKVKEEIYKSQGHILVALSRHTHTLTYYTPVTDELKRIIAKIIPASVIDKTKFRVKGGALPEVAYERPVKQTRCEFVNGLLAQTIENNTDTMLMIEKQFRILEKPPVESIVLNDADGGVNTLITLHDELLPGNAFHHHYLDSENMLSNEVNVELDGIQRVESKSVPKPAIYDKLRPVIPTMMPVSRRSSQLESIIALNKRNMAVPELDGVTDACILGERLLTQFVDGFVDPKAKFMLEEFKACPIAPNAEMLEEWLSLQPPTVRNQIVGPDDDVLEWDKWSTYKFMIKSTVKPVLDTTAPYVNSALQTIACQEKYQNAIFCPIFREMDRRIESIMKSRFKVFTRVDNEGFCDLMNHEMPPWKFDELLRRGAAMLEIDISKYDKSQGLAALIFDCMMMSMCGVADVYVKLWYHAHAHTVLVDRVNGVKYKVNYQRKSGDASTFCQNTRFLMAVVSTMFDMERVFFGMFAGDDSWLLTDGEFKDMNAWCATLLNLESKFFKFHNSVYFCSKYFAHDGSSWVILPDPVKLLVKLGRSDLCNYEHVEEYRLSLKDLTKSYENVLVCDKLAIALAERYNNNVNAELLLGSLRGTILCRDRFASLYYSDPSDRLCVCYR